MGQLDCLQENFASGNTTVLSGGHKSFVSIITLQRAHSPLAAPVGVVGIIDIIIVLKGKPKGTAVAPGR